MTPGLIKRNHQAAADTIMLMITHLEKQSGGAAKYLADFAMQAGWSKWLLGQHIITGLEEKEAL